MSKPKSNADSAEYSLDTIHRSGEYHHYLGSTILMPKMLQQLLSCDFNKKLEYYVSSGILTKDLPILFSALEKAGGKCVLQVSDATYVFAWKESYFNIAFDKKDKTISFAGWSNSPEHIQLFKELEVEFISKVKKNLIFSIIKTPAGLEIKSLGNGHSPLIEDNYLPKVLEDMAYVISSWQKDPPTGRIVILNGEPGTGKTHLIRSMLSQLDCVFLIIPSNLIDSLDKPEFLPLLISVKEQHEKPIIMIIEDGDICLVPRRGDNISTIASLLNISDGILGSLIDIKIVISTNVFINEVDQAILRPGRLCKQIHVGPLDFEQSNKVYQRIMGDPNVTLEKRRFYTLAEIYDKFNTRDSDGVLHHNLHKRVIGFHTAVSSTDRTMNRKSSDESR